MSDHLPNFILLCNPCKHIDLKHRPLIRLFTEKNKQIFEEKLKRMDWPSFFEGCNDDVNIICDKFLSATKQIFESSFPFQKKSRRACKDKIWITKGLKISSTKKFNLYKKWISTKSQLDENN